MKLNKDNLRLPQEKLGADIQVEKKFYEAKDYSRQGFDIVTR